MNSELHSAELKTQQVSTVEPASGLLDERSGFGSHCPDSARTGHLAGADITLQKQAEATSILEGNRMAREIHDHLRRLQAFWLGAAKQVLTDDLEATQAHLDLIKELARTGLKHVDRWLRSVLSFWRAVYRVLYIVSSLKSGLLQLTPPYIMRLRVQCILYPPKSNNLLRMGQEALTNAIRHANADEIRVELVYESNQFCCV